MRLTYDDIISPFPIKISGIGSIKSPKLSEIFRIGVVTYNYYLLLIVSDENFLTSNIISTNDMSYYDKITSNSKIINIFEDILNFFIVENVKYNKGENIFVLTDNEDIVGIIDNDNFDELRDIISQLNNIKVDKLDETKIKSKKALEIYKKIQSQKKKKKNANSNPNMDLSNIISAVSARHPSLNLTNIWDLTVNQLWDSFHRTLSNTIYDIGAKSVATWGNENNNFDVLSWYEQYYEK